MTAWKQVGKAIGSRGHRPEHSVERGGRRSPPRVAAALVITTVTVTAGMGVGTTPRAAADAVTLHYTCTLASFPSQGMTAQVVWTSPNSVVVGQPVPAVPVHATATVGPPVTVALALIGASYVSGSVDVTGVVNAPEGQISAMAHGTVPRTPVPGSGPLTITATATTPGLVFHQPGHATVTISRTLAAHADMTTVQGGPALVGHADVTCALDPGQNTVVASFEITPPAATPTLGGATVPSAHGGRSGTGASTRGPVIPGSVGSASSLTVPTTSALTTTQPVTPPIPPVVPADPPPIATVLAGALTVLDGWLLAVILAVAATSGGTVWWLMRRRCRRLHGSFR